jgi:hypothetical protein
MTAALVVLIASLVLSLPAMSAEVRDASGITRVGDYLLIVGDKDSGRFYRFPIPNSSGRAIIIDPEQAMPVDLPNGSLAIDLESIDVLADDRVVVLSERLRALIGMEGVIAEYGTPLTEFGNRGLEGVAVRRLSNGISKVAVLWEGGYPESRAIPQQLRSVVGHLSLRPVIWVHELTKGQTHVHVRDDRKDGVVPQTMSLEVQEVGDEPTPQAQRFRASDLVWHELNKHTHELGFIVLMSSENSPREGKRVFQYQWLQRFDMDGKRVGVPLDLNDVLPEGLRQGTGKGLDGTRQLNDSSLFTTHPRLTSQPHTLSTYLRTGRRNAQVRMVTLNSTTSFYINKSLSKYPKIM